MNCPHCNEIFEFVARIPDTPDSTAINFIERVSNEPNPAKVEYVHVRGNSPHVQVRVCPPRNLGKLVPADDYSWNPNYDPAEFEPLTQGEIDALGVEGLENICLCDNPNTCPTCIAEREADQRNALECNPPEEGS